MGMESLEYRRLKSDLTVVYKLLNNLIDTDADSLFVRSKINHNLRHHDLHLQKGSLSKTNIKLNFFANKIVDVWNKLPESVVTCKTLSSFKINLGHVDLKPLSNFVF